MLHSAAFQPSDKTDKKIEAIATEQRLIASDTSGFLKTKESFNPRG